MAKNKDKEVQLTASEKMTQSVDSWLGRHIKLIASIVIAVVAVIVIAAIVTVVVNNNQSKRYEKLDAVTASYAEFSAMDGDAEGYAEAKNNVANSLEEAIIHEMYHSKLIHNLNYAQLENLYDE